jgi:hypothetical protein
MQSILLLGSILGIIVALQSCAADRESRVLASQLQRLTSEYQANATAKIAAEKQFYLDSLKNLDAILGVVDPDPAAAQPDIKKTVAYGRIITNARADAQRLAESFIKDNEMPLTSATISAFLTAGVEADRAAFLRERQQQATVRTALITDFGKLEDYQAKLMNLSRQLVELEKSPTAQTRVSILRAIGDAVRTQLKASEKKPNP